MEQQTGSKLAKQYVEAVYTYPAYLNYMHSTSCKMPGWIKDKLESRLQEEAGGTVWDGAGKETYLLPGCVLSSLYLFCRAPLSEAPSTWSLAPGYPPDPPLPWNKLEYLEFSSASQTVPLYKECWKASRYTVAWGSYTLLAIFLIYSY